MIAVDECKLPETGGTVGLALAALVLMVIGFAVARWVRASTGRVAIIAGQRRHQRLQLLVSVQR